MNIRRHDRAPYSVEKLLAGVMLVALLPLELLMGEEAKTPVRTGFVYDPLYLKHETGVGHPERPERLTALVTRLEQQGLLAKLVSLKSAPISVEWVTTVHAPEYVERVRKSC